MKINFTPEEKLYLRHLMFLIVANTPGLGRKQRRSFLSIGNKLTPNSTEVHLKPPGRSLLSTVVGMAPNILATQREKATEEKNEEVLKQIEAREKLVAGLLEKLK